MDREGLQNRLKDEAYSKLINDKIDEFYYTIENIKLKELIKDPVIQDMAEVVMEFAEIKYSSSQPEMVAVVSFLLGVFLAYRNEAILPTQLN